MLQFEVDVVIAVDAEVVADAAAVGGDGLIVRNAVEAEEFLHTGKVGIGDTDSFFVGQPLIDILMVGFAALSDAFAGDEDKLHIIALGDFGTFCLTALDVRTARTATHTPEINNQISAWILGAQRADEVCGRIVGR